jgi:hypothetical protein
MKKLIVVLILLALALPVFAQAQSSSGGDSNMYYYSVTVERIYPSNEGYIVQYRRNNNLIGVIGIPNEWFSDAAGRAEMIRLPFGKNWPTMSVFYINGEFSHVRLYVHRVKSHQTWGMISQTSDVSSYFTDRESFNFQL